MHRFAMNYEDFGALAQDVLASGGSFRFIATGNSMWPFIRSGALLSVVRADPDILKIGDVVLYHSGDVFAVHRVIKIVEKSYGHSFLIRGDGCYDDGEVVKEDRILGRVVRLEQNGVVIPNLMVSSMLFIDVVRKIRQVLWYGRFHAANVIERISLPTRRRPF